MLTTPTPVLLQAKTLDEEKWQEGVSEESGSGLHREAETAFGSNESYRALVVTDVKRVHGPLASRPRHRSCSEDRVDRLEFGCREPPTACRV